MTVLADQVVVGVIGVDTHRDTLTAAAGPPAQPRCTPWPWRGLGDDPTTGAVASARTVAG